MGFDDFIPPYATASGRQLLQGVNFASAAAGIRDETGRQLVSLKSTSIVKLLGNYHVIVEIFDHINDYRKFDEKIIASTVVNRVPGSA